MRLHPLPAIAAIAVAAAFAVPAVPAAADPAVKCIWVPSPFVFSDPVASYETTKVCIPWFN